MSSQVLDLNPSLVASAKAADDAAMEAFHAKVVKLARFFSIKEAARLMRVSTGYLRTHAEKRGFGFADRDNRTRLRKRRIKKLWDYYMIHFDLRRFEVKAPPVQQGELIITPGLAQKSRQAWIAGQDVFMERCCELAELFTIAEAAEILGVSHRFLKNFGYNEQITFVGEPSLDVKNDFYFRAEELAKAQMPIAKAAKALTVTTRFLISYSKNWELPFELPETVEAGAGDEAESGASYMEDICLAEDDSDDEDVMADSVESPDVPSIPEIAPAVVAITPPPAVLPVAATAKTSTASSPANGPVEPADYDPHDHSDELMIMPPYFERLAPRTACGSTYALF